MPRRYPRQSLEYAIETLRQTIAANLRIEPDRLKFEPLPANGIGKRGTAGDHVRQWHGVPTSEAEKQR